jgi:hypothetical protein
VSGDITTCKLIYPYFDNPRMLEFQVENWNRFDDELHAAVEIIVVDDHSSKPALPILEQCNAPLRAYRLAERFPWNQHQCRNIGAREACTADENTWLFICDIHAVLQPDMARTMLTKTLDSTKYYTMEVTFQTQPSVRESTKHTILVRHAAFWRVNGYDLDLTPIGGGGYGGARQFIKQLNQVVSHGHLDDVVVVDYSRRAPDGSRLIEDADTTSPDLVDREAWKVPFREALRRKKQSGDMRSVNPIRVDYERIL